MSGPLVVTGASGFLGRALVSDLRQRKAETVAVSRRAEAGAVRVENYADTPAPRGSTLVHLAEESRVDLATEGSVRVAEQLLEALLEKGFERTVYASSGAVYGDTSMSSCRPGAPIQAGNFYLAGKLACEKRVLAAGGVVVRLANIYGPGMRDGTVVTDLLTQIGGNGPVTLRDLKPIRDFLWIGDAARGLAEAALGVAQGTFNLGSGVGTSIAELVSLACRMAGQDGREVLATSPSDQPSRLVLDIKDTTAAFGWRPEMALADGLALTISAR